MAERKRIPLSWVIYKLWAVVSAVMDYRAA
jgi:hypothetical protein